jgi:BCD family chlorophyll transporter-like MFS transporter
MSRLNASLVSKWTQLSTDLLPFAEVTSRDMPLSRLLRLSLFQFSVGMAAVLLIGTLNRVMIVELRVPAWQVALMISIPLLFAPARALIGFKSDNHRSPLGWRRVPYIWFGTMAQFGGLAIMPFALLIMSGDTQGSPMVGVIAAGLAFLLVGAGMHTVQTAGLALATDIATPETRPRVVAMLYITLLLGMLVSGVVLGLLLADFSALRLVKVIQGTAALTFVINMIALWKQEGRSVAVADMGSAKPVFSDSFARYIGEGRTRRLLIATGLGAAAFAMQDMLLEPYGGEILRMSVGATTSLTALWAAGTLLGLGIAARAAVSGADMHRMAGYGAVIGIGALTFVILAATFGSTLLLGIGVMSSGMGGGLFLVGTLLSAMALSADGQSGLALGSWGAVQAFSAGAGIAIGGILRDGVGHMAMAGRLGEALNAPATGYIVVYQIAIALLFATLVAIGPLARRASNQVTGQISGQIAGQRVTGGKFGLPDFPS